MGHKTGLLHLGLCVLLAISGCLSVPTRRLDWAINDINDSQVYYLISGDDYYMMNDYRKEKRSGKASDLFPGLPSGIQAATWWPGKDKYYFFKDGKYYCADTFGGSVSGPFDGSSLGEIFTRPIDAATTVKGKTYFFLTSHLYEYIGDKLIRNINPGALRLPGKMDAALTVGSSMYFFEQFRTWTVRPYRNGFSVRHLPTNRVFRIKSIVVG